MTAHVDVELYYHKTFATNPTDTQVDGWCTWCDALIAQLGSGLSAAIKTGLCCQAVLEILKQYRKNYMNAHADSTGEKDGSFTFTTVDIIKFIKNAILALDTCGDHVTFEVPGNT